MKKDSIKTLIILIPGFPKGEDDTTCLPAFQQFALSLKKCFPETEFIFIAFQYPYVKRDYLWHGIRVISLGGKNKNGLYKRITWLNAYRTLLKLKGEKNLLGVFSIWLSECALVGEYFCRKYDLKHYTWLIGQDAKKDNKYISLIKPKAEQVIAMSDFLQQELFNNHGLKPFMVAENGINESGFPEFNTGLRKIDILGVGSLIPLKNYSLFLDIIYEVKKNFHAINAVIAGSGEEEQLLKEKVKELGMEKNVSFSGLLPHTEVFNLMNNSKLFLHTSHYEGNSTVLMEALYCGCYTISTQALSDSMTKNLIVSKEKEELTNHIVKRLRNTELPAERITFNTMDDSAKKIMRLYL